MLRVSLGAFHTVVVLENGDCYAWGSNHYGQVGNGTTQEQAKPTRVLRGVRTAAAGPYHTVALLRDGDLYTWGCNSSGELGTGTTSHVHSPTKILEWVTGIAAGGCHSLAIQQPPPRGLEKFHCLAWGFGTSSDGTQTCGITGTGEPVLKPMKVLESAIFVSAGRNHSLAISKAGDCLAWGRNAHGQLGDGSTWDRLEPKVVMEGVRSVVAGMDCSFAVTSGGECFAWGCNLGGRLGDGSTLDRLRPVKILDAVASVAAGGYHNLALLENGDCLGWGCNQFGCIMSDDRPEVLLPLRLMGGVAHVIAGVYRSLAISGLNERRAWGQDWETQEANLNWCELLARDEAEVPTYEDYEDYEADYGLDETLPTAGGGEIDTAAGASGRAAGETGTPAAASARGSGGPEVEAAAGGASTEPPDPPNSAQEGAGAAGGDVAEPASEPGGSASAGAEQGSEAALGEEDGTKEPAGPSPDVLHSVGGGLCPQVRQRHEVLQRVHDAALRGSRSYTVRWTAFRRRFLEHHHIAGDHMSDPNAADKQAMLRTFHVELARDLSRFHEDRRRLDDISQGGWSAKDADPALGLPAIEGTLRQATRTVLTPEELVSLAGRIGSKE